MKLDWENIENLSDNEISYLLYLENKTISLNELVKNYFLNKIKK